MAENNIRASTGNGKMWARIELSALCSGILTLAALVLVCIFHAQLGFAWEADASWTTWVSCVSYLLGYSMNLHGSLRIRQHREQPGDVFGGPALTWAWIVLGMLFISLPTLLLPEKICHPFSCDSSRKLEGPRSK